MKLEVCILKLAAAVCTESLKKIILGCVIPRPGCLWPQGREFMQPTEKAFLRNSVYCTVMALPVAKVLSARLNPGHSCCPPLRYK